MLSKVIQIEDSMPHLVSELICICCGKRWVSVRPTSVFLKDIECPKCHKIGYVVNTGEIIEREVK